MVMKKVISTPDLSSVVTHLIGVYKAGGKEAVYLKMWDTPYKEVSQVMLIEALLKENLENDALKIPIIDGMLAGLLSSNPSEGELERILEITIPLTSEVRNLSNAIVEIIENQAMTENSFKCLKRKILESIQEMEKKSGLSFEAWKKKVGDLSQEDVRSGKIELFTEIAQLSSLKYRLLCLNLEVIESKGQWEKVKPFFELHKLEIEKYLKSVGFYHLVKMKAMVSNKEADKTITGKRKKELEVLGRFINKQLETDRLEKKRAQDFVRLAQLTGYEKGDQKEDLTAIIESIVEVPNHYYRPPSMEKLESHILSEVLNGILRRATPLKDRESVLALVEKIDRYKKDVEMSGYKTDSVVVCHKRYALIRQKPLKEFIEKLQDLLLDLRRDPQNVGIMMWIVRDLRSRGVYEETYELIKGCQRIVAQDKDAYADYRLHELGKMPKVLQDIASKAHKTQTVTEFLNENLVLLCLEHGKLGDALLAVYQMDLETEAARQYLEVMSIKLQVAGIVVSRDRELDLNVLNQTPYASEESIIASCCDVLREGPDPEARQALIVILQWFLEKKKTEHSFNKNTWLHDLVEAGIDIQLCITHKVIVEESVKDSLKEARFLRNKRGETALDVYLKKGGRDPEVEVFLGRNRRDLESRVGADASQSVADTKMATESETVEVAAKKGPKVKRRGTPAVAAPEPVVEMVDEEGPVPVATEGEKIAFRRGTKAREFKKALEQLGVTEASGKGSHYKADGQVFWNVHRPDGTIPAATLRKFKEKLHRILERQEEERKSRRETE